MARTIPALQRIQPTMAVRVCCAGAGYRKNQAGLVLYYQVAAV